MTAAAADVVVRNLVEAHWPEVERIYRQGIITGNATFETSPPTWHQFNASRLPGHRLAAIDAAGQVVGWAAVTRVSTRTVYAGVVEHSIYVDEGSRGHGVGKLLLKALARSTEEAGIWTIQSGIFPENTASIGLHLGQGFRVIGTRERIARTNLGPYAGLWRDTVLMERRSTLIGAGNLAGAGPHFVDSIQRDVHRTAAR
ncbi:N-acetyltransferase [Paenarthrobacter sp. Z7-10]|uniref:GNAT family N-acetyltransferase n=1 Tax=Paenarthrobacter sp. Z7-10 TaxID=2787635 RepID=UPI0022A98F10|nr:GNAT family N-acetyltransferase [Paenarthrobacter sp. Z7-10]MCZ2403832.1 N-acetyltransferase [Paenarthrobacter sp. Z7-10]